MTNPFREYAKYYDLLYKDKDYLGEARFVARLLGRSLHKPTEQTDILDLACGTGRHAQELARMGYHVEGSDISPDMIEVANDRARSLDLPIHYYNESFQSCDRIGRKYDAIIAMFSAINYLTDYRDFAKSLDNIRALLRKEGVFVFDFWNGNAVLNSYSPTRIKRAEDGENAVIRISNTSLDTISQIAKIKFNFMLISAGNIVREFSEVHRIRYFFPQEMADSLAANGYEIVHRCPFLRDEDAMEPDEWNLTYVVRPCG